MSNRVFQILAVFTLLGLRDAQAQGDNTDLSPSPEKRMAAEAKLTYEGTMAAYQTGNLKTAEIVYIWSKRWMDSDLENATTPGERRKAYFAHYGRMKDLNGMAAAQRKAGEQDEAGVHATEFYLAEAELILKKSRINDPASAPDGKEIQK